MPGAGALLYRCQGARTWLKQGRANTGRADEDMQSRQWELGWEDRWRPQSGACVWIRDRRPRVQDWEGEKRSEKQSHTEAVKSLQVGKARFGGVPDTASKGWMGPDNTERLQRHIRRFCPDPTLTGDPPCVSLGGLCWSCLKSCQDSNQWWHCCPHPDHGHHNW